MQAGDFDDLIPLFLDEAEDRLERLAELAPRVTEDDEAAAVVRRELHALKGASRMMGLVEMSDLCHDAETLVEKGGSEVAVSLVAAIDGLAGLLAQRRQAAVPELGSATTDAAPLASRTGSRTPSDQTQMRVGATVLDRLADRASRMRVLAVAAGGVKDRIFELSRLAERGMADESPEQVLATLASLLRRAAFELEGGERRLSRLVDRQLNALIGLQLQPLKPFLIAVGRHARDLAHSLGKEVEVVISADGGQLDRRVLTAIEEMVLHLVRNAVDHGIEPADERTAAGKPAAGRLRLTTGGAGERVRLEIEDDGRGIDPKLVVNAARARGLVGDEELAALGPDDALRLLFRPGFTTREAAGAVSGRGVGLDAVAEAVRSVGGDVLLASEPGRGTQVTLLLPVTRHADRLLVVSAAGFQVGLPAAGVVAYRHVAKGSATAAEPAHGAPAVRSLGELLAGLRGRDEVHVEVSFGGVRIALAVDAVVGEEEVVLRPLPPGLGAPACFTDMALLASGRPVPVVSVHDLASRTGVRSDMVAAQLAPGPVRVLLVDDSRVTREMLRRVLEDGGFEVTSFGSAEEALRALEDGGFDCVVTDIEMPDMNGLELTRALRANPALAQLPVVVVSTRNRPEDHRAGLAAGADAYLAKQGLEARELLAVVARLGAR